MVGMAQPASQPSKPFIEAVVKLRHTVCLPSPEATVIHSTAISFACLEDRHESTKQFEERYADYKEEATRPWSVVHARLITTRIHALTGQLQAEVGQNVFDANKALLVGRTSCSTRSLGSILLLL